LNRKDYGTFDIMAVWGGGERLDFTVLVQKNYWVSELSLNS
jgi:hypothetical protein